MGQFSCLHFPRFHFLFFFFLLQKWSEATWWAELNLSPRLVGLLAFSLASASSPSERSSTGFGRNIIWPWRVIWFSTLINSELTIWLVIEFGGEEFFLSLLAAPDLVTDNFRSLMLAFVIPCDVLRAHIQQIALRILTPSLINLTADIVLAHLGLPVHSSWRSILKNWFLPLRRRGL